MEWGRICTFAKVKNRNKMNFPEKIVDWLLDIAKYVLSAIVITSFLADLSETWMIYVFGSAVASICFLSAVLIARKISKNLNKK